MYGAGGLAEEVNEAILHAAFIPFGEIKDVKTPLDQATQKHRSFGFVTFLEKEDATAAMDNMDGAELYGRVLTVNYALPERIKGGEQGWAAHPSKWAAPYHLSSRKICNVVFLFSGSLQGTSGTLWRTPFDASYPWLSRSCSYVFPRDYFGWNGLDLLLLKHRESCKTLVLGCMRVSTINICFSTI